MSSDLDVSQVAYSGDDTLASSQGLYFSPPAFVAYASGFITARSKRKDPCGRWVKLSTMNRITRYMLRGFGFRANGAWDDIQGGFHVTFVRDAPILRQPYWNLNDTVDRRWVGGRSVVDRGEGL